MPGGTHPRDLADSGKERLRIVALAEGMFGLFGLQLVGEFSDLLEVPAVLLDLSGQLPAECRSGASLFRSEEHTSELQSHVNLVCRLLLEKKKINNQRYFCINRENSASVR